MTLKAEAYPVKTICGVLDLPRSSFYHAEADDANAELRLALQELAAQYPTYGYRRLTALLRRQGWTVNRKRVQRLMGEMKLQACTKRRKKHTTDSRHSFPRYPNLVKGMTITRPDEVWVSDISYVRLQRDFVYLAIVMDVYTRAMRGWELSRSLDQSLTLNALHRGLAHSVPLIHHSDQGVQYAAWNYTELLLSRGIRISMAAIGKPEENGYAERVIRTIREECIDLSEYADFWDAYRQIGHFLEGVYTHKRIHSALGYLTPAEFEQQWDRQQSKTAALK